MERNLAPGRVAALAAVGLEKRFGPVAALKGVDLGLAEGEFMALFGPNGAGKTTLIRILAGLARPTGGRVLVGGLDARECTAEVRRRIGVVTHQTYLYRDLTAEQNLLLYARLYDLPDARERVHEALERAALGHRAGDPVRALSRGMQQRVTIARALLHDPFILLLDEPYSGLDQHAASALTGTLQELAGRRRSVLMATHDLEQGLQLADRVGILAGGCLLLEQQAAGLTAASWRRFYLGAVEGATA
jgi:heme exporter protein A